jgi:5-methylcytosine-specific restriction enzyme A
VIERLRGRAGVRRRQAWLRQHPLCERCKAKGYVREATVPDHVVALANGGRDTWDNLQSLCDECHAEKTAEDLGYRRRVSVGLDGWPVEGK